LIGVLIVTHGYLGNELLNVAEMMFGPQEAVAAVSLAAGDSVENFQARLAAALASLPGGETLILADLFGGTPANAAARLVRAGSCHLVAGVSLPMLLEVLGARAERGLADLTALAADAGRAAVTVLSDIR
jgi:PTS system mannose-specific IIA component